MHLPRTGGTTLHDMIAAAFPPDRICPERFQQLRLWEPEQLRPFALFSGHFSHATVERIPGDKRVVTVLREPRARVISTYRFWARHSAAWIAEGRMPGVAVARRSSLAEFLASPEPEVRDAVDNLMARFLAGHISAGGDGPCWEVDHFVDEAEVVERAERNLRRMDVVGVTEDLDGLYARLAASCGLPPMARLPRLNSSLGPRPDLDPAPAVEITPEADAMLARLTRMDQPLYQLARRLAGLD